MARPFGSKNKGTHLLCSTPAFKKFNSHKYNAKRRGVEFNLTFDEWNNWWLSHGVNKQIVTRRGIGDGNKLCMCRYNDTGPYALNNIYCDTNYNNVKEQLLMRYKKLKEINNG
jgi:hypothetical protein